MQTRKPGMLAKLADVMSATFAVGLLIVACTVAHFTGIEWSSDDGSL